MEEINNFKEQDKYLGENKSEKSDVLPTPEITPPTETEPKEAEQKPEQSPSETKELPQVKFIPPKQTKKDLRSVRPPRDEITVRVEKILEEDLRDQYERMSPIAQQEFKLEGERVADQIREMLKSAHVKVKKIFALIADWLSMIPGVNKFFLEQEAKIKTDKIIAIKKQNGN